MTVDCALQLAGEGYLIPETWAEIARTLAAEVARLRAIMASDEPNDDDVCGLCGESGADKYAHPVHWPGERIPDGPLVHAKCEDEEYRRAYAALTDQERESFLRRL